MTIMRTTKKAAGLKNVGKTYIFFIIRNGYYPQFMKWCTTKPKLFGRSQNLKAYLFLKSTKWLLDLFYQTYSYTFKDGFDLEETCCIAKTPWLNV